MEPCSLPKVEDSSITTGSVIGNIPDEILHIIFSYFPGEDSLLNISLTCSRFRSLAEPFRYHTTGITLESPFLPSYVAYAGEQSGNIDSYKKLMALLIERPYVRRYICSVSINVLLNPFQVVFEDQNDLLRILPCMKSLTLSPPPPSLDISSCTVLRCLKLDFKHKYDYWSPEVSDNRQSTESIYHSETHLFSQCLLFPRLRCLIVHGLNLSASECSQYISPECTRMSSITDLCILQGSAYVIEMLPNILGSIKELQHFTFEFEPHTWRRDPHVAFATVASLIGSAVTQHAGTLLKLNISTSERRLKPWLPTHSAGFSRLRYLAIPESFLPRSTDLKLMQSLPPSLEEIQVQHPVGFHELKHGPRALSTARVGWLVNKEMGVVPNLKRLIWWDQDAEQSMKISREVEQERTELIKVFRLTGVELEIMDALYWNETPFGANNPEESIS